MHVQLAKSGDHDRRQATLGMWVHMITTCIPRPSQISFFSEPFDFFIEAYRRGRPPRRGTLATGPTKPAQEWLAYFVDKL